MANPNRIPASLSPEDTTKAISRTTAVHTTSEQSSVSLLTNLGDFFSLKDHCCYRVDLSQAHGIYKGRSVNSDDICCSPGTRSFIMSHISQNPHSCFESHGRPLYVNPKGCLIAPALSSSAMFSTPVEYIIRQIQSDEGRSKINNIKLIKMDFGSQSAARTVLGLQTMFLSTKFISDNSRILSLMDHRFTRRKEVRNLDYDVYFVDDVQLINLVREGAHPYANIKSTKILCLKEMTLIDLLDVIVPNFRNQSLNQAQLFKTLAQALKGLLVQRNYNLQKSQDHGRVVRIRGLGAPASSQAFKYRHCIQSQNSNSGQGLATTASWLSQSNLEPRADVVTVQGYYETILNKPVSHPHLPVVNISSIDQPTWVLVEFLDVIPSQIFPKRLFKEMKRQNEQKQLLPSVTAAKNEVARWRRDMTAVAGTDGRVHSLTRRPIESLNNEHVGQLDPRSREVQGNLIAAPSSFAKPNSI